MQPRKESVFLGTKGEEFPLMNPLSFSSLAFNGRTPHIPSLALEGRIPHIPSLALEGRGLG